MHQMDVDYLQNNSTNNTASIITGAWCLYCHTKVSLVILLLKELQQGCNEGHGKEENFMPFSINPLYFSMDMKMVDMSTCQHFATQKFR
jgi:hypothetical protein